MSDYVDEIESLVKAGEGQSFAGSDFRTLRQPGVYAFMLGDECLYVGMAKNLMQRVVGVHHRQEAIDECDRVLLWPCKDKEAAAQLEAILILRLHPKYNIRSRSKLVNQRLGNSAKHDERITDMYEAHTKQK